MRAIELAHYGRLPKLIEDLPQPMPREGEVQVRVFAASINPLDRKIMSGALRLVVREGPPRGMGVDFAGVIAAIGDNVTGWRVGESVFGALDPSRRQGSFAEYLCVAANALTRKPTNVSYEAAATLGVAGGTAVQALVDQSQVHAGAKVLLIGATGGVGTFAMQLARHLRLEVTAVCAARNLEHARDLGARHVLAYENSDFHSLPEAFDVIFDVAGVTSFQRCKLLLKPESGLFLTTRASPGVWLKSITTRFSRRRAQGLVWRANLETLDDLASLAARGILTPHIDAWKTCQTPWRTRRCLPNAAKPSL
jgi:NADPH:quinone reductase-like Zn-dependent oxidoreductase